MINKSGWLLWINLPQRKREKERENSNVQIRPGVQKLLQSKITGCGFIP
jgi:hypothetical protein